MLRGTVRKHRIGSAALALCAGLGFIALACETPTPPSSVELKVDFEASQVPAEVAEQGDGYFVFKKEGGKLEYVQPLAPDELSVLQESGERATFKAYEVAPSNEKTPPAGSVSLVREVSPEVISTLAKKGQPGEGAVVRLREAAEPGGAAPAPLVIVDGVITGLSPGALSELSPKEIKSIEIIKGKAAESLYGERARGGVIQVTTKG